MSYCYICFDEHSEENPLMKSLPCNCKGSCGEIHYTCFEGIRRKRFCPNCKASLPLIPIVPPDLISDSDEEHLYYWKEDSDGNKHGAYFEFVKLHENNSHENMYVIQRQGNYINGIKQGTWYLWKPDGTISMENQYYNGIHYGEQKRIMPDGKIITWIPNRHIVAPKRL